MTTDLRHTLLYAEQNWKQTGRLLFILALGYGVLGSVGFGIFSYTQTHRVSLQALQLAIYIPLAFVILAGYRYYRYRARIEFGESGFQVYKLFRVAFVPYDAVRSGRVMPLRAAYTNGLPKYVPPIKKAFLDSQVLVVKLRGEPATLLQIKRGLGAYYAVDQETAAFPLRDAQAAADDLRRHLPEKLGTNQGGAQRRGKRRR